ncbi:hypothetical protein FVE67_01855 [Thermosulfurimonas marina]|uniref:Polysaccharide chain length determinant N-terminal domain-containing protein n=1 Tax=Thermosulfurimonas marina TaxID=2047767 RepID=A0A6H1WR47_9BACT|nr:Wzz/FepE/Etk N-terminal domain-containing protein [Thermosulfurimonas marina]QJA05616.1 hypothetical protein FVE67_01855 [Thermosulfurimonas marina]
MAEEKRETPVCPAAGPFYTAEDEIDLYELFLVLWRRKGVVVFTFLIFVLAAALYAFLSPPVYRQTVLIKLPLNNMPLNNMPLLSANEAKEIVLSLENLLKEHDYNRLARFLKIKEDEAREIVEISPQTLRKSENLLKVSIETRNRELLPKISTQLVAFINENPYLREKIRVWEQTLDQKEHAISSRLASLEHLKNYILSEIQKGKLRLLGFNPLDLEGFILDLKQQLEIIKAQRELISGAELVVSGALPRRPAKPKRALILAVAGVSGLFVGVFLAFFREWWEEARRRYQEEAREKSIR